MTDQTDLDRPDGYALEGDEAVWETAYEALRKGGDPVPLANLLKQAKTPNDWILRHIGVMLDPPKRYRGPRLMIKPEGKRSMKAAAESIRRRRELRARILVVKGLGSVEPAIQQVMNETGLSRAAVYEAYATDEYRAVMEAEAILGNLDDEEFNERVGKRRRPPK